MQVTTTVPFSAIPSDGTGTFLVGAVAYGKDNATLGSTPPTVPGDGNCTRLDTLQRYKLDPTTPGTPWGGKVVPA